MTATCANDDRGKAAILILIHTKLTCCPSILTSRTSCTSPTRRKFKGKSTRAFVHPQSLPPILTRRLGLWPHNTGVTLPSQPPNLHPHRPFSPHRPSGTSVTVVRRQKHDAPLASIPQPWTLPACGTGFRQRSTRTPPSDNRPSSTSSMCVLAANTQRLLEHGTDGDYRLKRSQASLAVC